MITVIHKILKHYKMYSIFNRAFGKVLKLCASLSSKQTLVDYGIKLKLSCIEILSTFKLETSMT